MQYLLTNAYFFSKIIIGTFSVGPIRYWEHLLGKHFIKKEGEKNNENIYAK